MSATAIALLIAQYGIPLAEQIWKTLIRYEEPTPEMWAELRALNAKSLLQRKEEAGV